MLEGKLSNALGWSSWRPEWKRITGTLLEWGLIKEQSTNHGNTRELFLTDDGKEWSEDFFGYPSPYEQGRTDILAAGKPEPK